MLHLISWCFTKGAVFFSRVFFVPIEKFIFSYNIVNTCIRWKTSVIKLANFHWRVILYLLPKSFTELIYQKLMFLRNCVISSKHFQWRPISKLNLTSVISVSIKLSKFTMLLHHERLQYLIDMAVSKNVKRFFLSFPDVVPNS